MLAWLDAEAAVQYAQEIIGKIVSAMPLEVKPNSNSTLAKRTEKLEKVLAQVSRSESRRFNIYQKAKLGNALKWGLREHGYPKDFVDEIVRLILMKLT